MYVSVSLLHTHALYGRGLKAPLLNRLLQMSRLPLGSSGGVSRAVAWTCWLQSTAAPAGLQYAGPKADRLGMAPTWCSAVPAGSTLLVQERAWHFLAWVWCILSRGEQRGL